MARRISGTARIRALDGTPLLELNAGPLELVSWTDDELVRDRQPNESPFVDGDDESTPPRYVSTVIGITVRARGATWAAAEHAFQSVLDAVTAAPEWLLERELEGVVRVWRANPPTSLTSPADGVAVANRRRLVDMRVPVQPNPTLTFPEEP
jgi:hypothetical protein